MEEAAKYPIVYFDGVCNLCNGIVQFIIKHDKKKQFRFAPLQSASGKKMSEEFGDSVADTVVLQHRGKYYTKSDAALQVLKLLGGVWSMGVIGYVLPRSFRNSIYEKVAANRYRWFGRQDACMIPTPELKNRFLG